ncbi:hypothetical protein MTO96_005284 [Rhipicephalus appendiculatus]
MVGATNAAGAFFELVEARKRAETKSVRAKRLPPPPLHGPLAAKRRPPETPGEERYGRREAPREGRPSRCEPRPAGRLFPFLLARVDFQGGGPSSPKGEQIPGIPPPGRPDICDIGVEKKPCSKDGSYALRGPGRIGTPSV